MSHYEQFYVQPADVGAAFFVLRDQEREHAVRVCRKRVGDQLAAVDGQGHRYQGEVMAIDKQEMQVRLQQHDYGFAEPRLQLTLAAALLKGGHFDEVVEKGVELGVSCLQPLITERTIADPSGQRMERWQEKARSAMKQCGRSVCPAVLAPVTLLQFLEQTNGQARYLAHAESERSASPVLNGPAVYVLIGPEGGFTDEEAAACLALDVRPLSLGPRRLRAETAAVVAVTVIMAAAGEMGYCGL